MTDEELATFDQEFRGRNEFGTHWEGCYKAHADCLVLRLIAEVRRLRELADFEVNRQLHDDNVKLRDLLDECKKVLDTLDRRATRPYGPTFYSVLARLRDRE